ncbi:MAG: hypothetical protein KDB07_08020 [Planctomycetes bacterium]|nr:hypothetical protein [Planctomycetota bacterium]
MRNFNDEETHTFTVSSSGVLTRNNNDGDCKTAAELVLGSLKREFPPPLLDHTLPDIKSAMKTAKGKELEDLKRARKIMTQLERLQGKPKGGRKKGR